MWFSSLSFPQHTAGILPARREPLRSRPCCDGASRNSYGTLLRGISLQAPVVVLILFFLGTRANAQTPAGTAPPQEPPSLPSTNAVAEVSNSPSNHSTAGAVSVPPVAVHGPLTSTNPAVEAAWKFFAGTNGVAKEVKARPAENFKADLEIARFHRRARQFEEATEDCVHILKAGAPEDIKRAAMIELAETATDQNDLARAQQVYAQYLATWPKDPSVPDVLLRQGLVFRQMGLPNLAVSKFYAVMTSSLVLKPEKFDYYQKLVLRAQNEIAQTQFQLGDWADAADSFARLLKLEKPPDNRSTIQFRLIRCLVALERYDDAIFQARDFLTQYPDNPERPEVHFLYATSLKKRERNSEALQQVLALLKEEHANRIGDPATLSYWQRRAGNEIANQFYKEGDLMKALDIYLSLASLGTKPDWQFPAWYQVGLVFERLEQPVKAIEYYGKITQSKDQLSTNAPPSLKAVVEMAQWRESFLTWQTNAAMTSFRLLQEPPSAPTNSVDLSSLQSSL